VNHREIKDKIPLFIANELNEKDTEFVENHIKVCKECRLEYEEFVKLENVFDQLSFKDPDELLEEEYWSGIYNRLEKTTGVLFATAGAVIFLFLGALFFFQDFLFNSDNSLLLRVGSGILIGGIIVLLVSIVREQYFYYKKERYKEVKK
jgi:hypothetical protein